MSEQTSFSLIIPTFKEAKNIAELVQRIAHINFETSQFEVILVDDDSQDGTVEIVASLQAQYPWLKLIVRHDKKGLSAAVLEGFQAANYSVLVLMDADLSHPPEKIPAMLAALQDDHVDFVLGSRYVPGGSTDEKWPWLRQITSRFSAALARLILPAQVKDPLSGFFMLRKSTLIAGNKLNPIGWKIGLEIMLKCHCLKIKEVPIHFALRKHGQSKLSFKVMCQYLQHINQLLLYKIK